ncbi:MAG TPA: sulfatase [Verrucomicrobiales bacterium]|nr:sulfatase [Verrucomicrobiales bacterium]
MRQLLTSLLIGLWVAVTAVTATAAAPPNIILILTDDQGWPMMSEPMHPDIPESATPYFHTPAMNRLAREGMRFTSGYSPGPLCTPTRRSLQNGMTPARQRGTEFKSTWVPADHLTLPQALKQANPAYVCAHFGKWGEDMISTPEQCGYAASDGMTGNVTGGAGPDRFDDAVKDDPKLISTLTKRAMAFMATQVKERRPFYLQLSHYAVHRQNQALSVTNEKYLAKGKPTRQFTPTFAAMLEDLNTGLTQLLDEVDRLGIAGSTHIVFTADNGGNRTYAGTDTTLPLNNHPLRMGKQYLYEGGIRVPFIVRGPGVKPGSVSHEPVAGYDLLPTFYDLAGGQAALPADLDGGSFRTVLENAGEGKVRRALPGLVFHRPHLAPLPHSTIRIGDLKLVVNWKTGEKELFDLSKDLGEANNLAATMPEKTGEMFEVLSNYLKSVNAETLADRPQTKAKKKKAK